MISDMKQLFSKWFGLVAFMCAWLCLPMTASAADDEPIIEFKTIVAEKAGGSSVTVFLGGFKEETDYLDFDCGSGLEEQELKQAELNTEDGTWSGGLKFTCTPGEDGVVKIYGDPANIAVINFDGCYISQLKMAKMENLYYLNLDHNELEALDLTQQTALQYLTVADNPFNKSPMKLSTSMPNIKHLAIGQTGNVDPELNISNYPSLIIFDAYACKGLKSVDPSGCPELQRLSLDGTNISSLDISNNHFLTILNISDTNVEEIDLSDLEFLQQFYADRQGSQTKLKKLDVSANRSLVYLFAAGNGLTEVDLTKNKYLQQLYLANNNLTHIDLSKNGELVNVILRNNYFTFATLPAPQDTWGQYDYYQNNMAIAKTVKVGDVLDFSDRVLREGTETTCAVFMVDEIELETTQLDESYYKYENGKVTFLKAPEKPVYLAFANSMFTEMQLDYMPLRTAQFRVRTVEDFGKPDIAFSLTTKSASPEVKMNIGMEGATADNPKSFYVDFGDGELKTFTTTTDKVPENPNVVISSTRNTLTVYVPQDEVLTAIGVDGMKLSSINLSSLLSLAHLSLKGTELFEIDLGYNRALKSLVLNGNFFESLNIRGVNDYFQKNYLTDIDLSDNAMVSVTLNDMGGIRNLNLSNNMLTELSLKDADNMQTLNLSNNYLTSVNLSYMTLMTKCDISNNQIAECVMPDENSLTEFKCEENNLNFSSMPQLTGIDVFTFSPQKDVKIVTLAPSIDLENHNVNGNTEYVWKLSDTGAALTKDTDYRINDGMTRFLSPIFGKNVYCEMTNPIFPGLVLKTTDVEAADMPTNKLATFKTTEDGTATLILRVPEGTQATTICIDWKGGDVVETYFVDENLTILSPKIYKGRECAVYAYDANAPLSVFSITGAKLADVDLTNMKNIVLANVSDAGISEIKLPESDNLKELILNKNNFTSIDLTRYADQLVLLSMNENKLTSFDASPLKKLQMLRMAANELSDVKLNNSDLWELELTGNKLESINLKKLPKLHQAFLGANQLSSLNLKNNFDLKVLHIYKNKFTFSTLPLPTINEYQYGEQANVDVNVVDGVVDLSADKEVDGTPTTYRWFVDMPYYDENTGELTGEELYYNDECRIEDGKTYFLAPINNVVCAMLNEKFPNLTIYTNPINVETAGINGVETEKNNEPVKVFNINGMQVDKVKANGVYITKQGKNVRKTIIK